MEVDTELYYHDLKKEWKRGVKRAAAQGRKPPGMRGAARSDSVEAAGERAI